jgi:tetratricopeptide (TPR) repeat protein
MAVTSEPNTKKPTTPVPLLMPQAGDHFGPYRLLSEVARGGMGVIFKARQTEPDRIVALKMILPFRLHAPEIVRRFRIEAEAVAKLSHPNILPVYEAGERDGIPYFSMRLTEGGNLGEAMPHLLGQTRQSVKLLLTIARATQHAHERGILHRDLKPANVLIDADGTAFVADFGLAKMLEPAADAISITQSNAGLGTPHYAAPEQSAGSGGALTPAVDVYSLGAILYEMLSGRPPFSGATMYTVMRRAAEGSAPLLRSVDPQIPADLEAICDRCLQPDPRLRYATASALADDLQRWLDGQPLAPWSPPLLPQVTLWIRQHRLLLLVGVALLLVGLGLAVGLRIRKARPDIDVGGSSNPEAVHFLQRSLEVNPTTNLTERRRLEETEELLQRAVSADPTYAAAQAEISRVHSQMYWHFHDHTEARAERAFVAANEALRLKPGYARGHLALAEYWFRCRREDAKALQELALARERTPRDPDIYNLTQLVAKRQARWEDAVSAIRTLCELRPTNARDQEYLGDTLQFLRRYPEALTAFDRAIYLAPEESDYVLGRARLLFLWKGELGPLEKLVQSLPRDELVGEHGFDARLLLFRHERRFDEWLQLIQSLPDGYVYRDKTSYWPKPLLLALVHRARGENDAASERLEEALAIVEAQRNEAPGEARVHAALGLIHALLGHNADAIREGERATELMPIKLEPVFAPNIRLNLAQIHLYTGHPAEACAMLRELLAEPGDLTIPVLLADPAWDAAREDPEFQALLNSKK